MRFFGLVFLCVSPWTALGIAAFQNGSAREALVVSAGSMVFYLVFAGIYSLFGQKEG